MAHKYMSKKDTPAMSQAGQALSQEVSQNPGVPMDTMRSMLMDKAMADRSRRIDLPEAMRAKMEAAFGINIGGVKLYESEKVADAGANAIARGGSIAFAPGKDDFNSLDGQRRLGHELSHIASQARGEVTGNGFLDNGALEARADREGAMAAAGEQVYDGPMMDAPSFSAAAPMQADGGKKSKKEADGGKKSKKESDNPKTQDDNAMADVIKLNEGLDLGSPFNPDIEFIPEDPIPTKKKKKKITTKTVADILKAEKRKHMSPEEMEQELRELQQEHEKELQGMKQQFEEEKAQGAKEKEQREEEWWIKTNPYAAKAAEKAEAQKRMEELDRRLAESEENLKRLSKGKPGVEEWLKELMGGKGAG